MNRDRFNSELKPDLLDHEENKLDENEAGQTYRPIQIIKPNHQQSNLTTRNPPIGSSTLMQPGQIAKLHAKQIFGFNIIRKLQVEREDAGTRTLVKQPTEDWIEQAQKLSN